MEKDIDFEIDRILNDLELDGIKKEDIRNRLHELTSLGYASAFDAGFDSGDDVGFERGYSEGYDTGLRDRDNSESFDNLDDYGN